MAKSNFFKNPQRGHTKKFQPYTPQYVLRGLEPEVIASATLPETFEDDVRGKPVKQSQTTRHAPVVFYDNPRTRPAPLPTVARNIPFAEMPRGPSPIGEGPVPNVGNNVENTWASVDGDVFDDISEDAIPRNELDLNQKMFDNNNDDPRAYRNIPSAIRQAPQIEVEEEPEGVYYQQYNRYYDWSNKKESKVLSDTSDKKAPVEKNKVDSDFEYVLMVDGEVVSTGFLEEIQEEVRALVYGEHYLCENANITPDDIIVLKKVKIKIGVFIE